MCAHVWVGGGACAWGCGRAQQDPQAQKVGEYLKLVAAQHRALRLLVSRYLVPGISLLPAWLAGRQKRPGGGGVRAHSTGCTQVLVHTCWYTRVDAVRCSRQAESGGTRGQGAQRPMLRLCRPVPWHAIDRRAIRTPAVFPPFPTPFLCFPPLSTPFPAARPPDLATCLRVSPYLLRRETMHLKADVRGVPTAGSRTSMGRIPLTLLALSPFAVLPLPILSLFVSYAHMQRLTGGASW